MISARLPALNRIDNQAGAAEAQPELQIAKDGTRWISP
jgi:hypothetical protein